MTTQEKLNRFLSKLEQTYFYAFHSIPITMWKWIFLNLIENDRLK